MTKNKIIMLAMLVIVFTVSSCSNSDDSCTESVWYEDSDKDGFGNSEVTQLSCTQPENFVSNSDDIDDTNATLNPNTVWQGSKITFTKADNADWTQEANQDRITDNVWITRADYYGIFNIVVEDYYTRALNPPSDTQWAIGTTADIGSLTFQNWEDMKDSCPYPDSIVNQDLVVHLITDNIYIDIKFTAWSIYDNGGGFSYERSTKN